MPVKDEGEKLESYISRRIYRTTHHNNLLDPQERLWIFSRRNSEVSQWSNSHNSDCVRLVLCKNLQHDFMRRFQRRDEK